MPSIIERHIDYELVKQNYIEEPNFNIFVLEGNDQSHPFLKLPFVFSIKEFKTSKRSLKCYLRG